MLINLWLMMRAIGRGRGAALFHVAARALALGGMVLGGSACGSPSEGDATLFQPLEPPGTVRGDVPPDPPAATPSATPAGSAEGMAPASMLPEAMGPMGTPPGTTPAPSMMGSMMGNGTPAVEDRQPGACRAPLGVSGSPQTISETLVLLNTLPKPTTLECFLQALDRPLNVYFTSSFYSLQPAPEARSPRTFIQRGNLYMSIVFGGAAMDTLEFGYRTVPSRSIKAEIVFPITRDLTEDTLFDRIARSDTTSVCGDCHVSEAREELPGFPAGAYVSEIFEPYDNLEVDLETMRAESETCEEDVESARCGLLAALFENGPLVQGTLPGKP